MLRNKKLILLGATAILFAGLLGLTPEVTHAATNISNSPTTAHWAWNDIIGWMDFYGTLNVNVNKFQLTGYASSSVGYISLDCATSPDGDICGTANYKVINDGSGNLSGWAWNDEIGWISFCGGNSTAECPYGIGYHVQIDQSGTTTSTFSGWAWNDIVGWISFNCSSGGAGGPGVCGVSQYDVETTWIATSTSSYLDSTTYDTGIQGGAVINSIMWLGTLSGGAVSFQFAASNASSGPWSYATSTNYVVSVCSTVNSCTPTVVDYTLNNNRYFRYRATLASDLAQRLTPLISDIIVNWSP
jgi:hypothetical protein